MPNGLRAVLAVLAVVAGLLTWAVVATVGNWLVRAAVPGYVDVEKAMTFTQGMLLARLLVATASSVAAGVACGAVMRRTTRWPAYVLAGLLLALFLPVHASLWHTFPIWYHVVFLGSLVPLALLGWKWGMSFGLIR